MRKNAGQEKLKNDDNHLQVLHQASKHAGATDQNKGNFTCKELQCVLLSDVTKEGKLKDLKEENSVSNSVYSCYCQQLLNQLGIKDALTLESCICQER